MQTCPNPNGLDLPFALHASLGLLAVGNVGDALVPSNGFILITPELRDVVSYASGGESIGSHETITMEPVT